MRRADLLREWYVNEIWGRRATDDDALFEVMSLQVFQAGLTWKMILDKRDAFRNAFAGWKIDAVAAMGPDDVERLRQDGGIVRNRLKIEGVIENARRVQAIRDEHGGFCRWFYETLEGQEYPPLAQELKRRVQVHGAGDRADVADGVGPHHPRGGRQVPAGSADCRTGRPVMCRSIKVLRNADAPATDADIEAAALQFVRKISGYRQPSRANAEAFDAAVADVAEASRRLLSLLGAPGAG